MYVNLPIRSTKECRELLVNLTDLPAGMFCAGYLKGGKDSCQVTRIFLFIIYVICKLSYYTICFF